MNDEYIERVRVVINGYRELAVSHLSGSPQEVHKLKRLDHLADGLGIGVGVAPGGDFIIPSKENNSSD